MSFMARNIYLHSTVSSSVSGSFRAIFPSAPRCGRVFYSQRGFSLLELLLVLFILGLMAASAVLLTQGVEDQSKYDETRRRMERIKQAMIGDPARSVNGSREISGFVTDMGRLPACLAELLAPGVLQPDDANPATPPEYKSCGSSAVNVRAWHRDAVSGLWSGWRGPYLDALPDRADGQKRFRDGYGNAGDDDNFGWDYQPAASGVISLASTAQDSQSPQDDIADAAFLIEDDYRLDLTAGGIRLHIVNRTGSVLPGPGQDLKLRLYHVSDGRIVSGDSVAITATAVSGVPALDEVELMPGFAASMKPAQGVAGFVVLCADNTLYEGTACAGNPAPDDVELITLVPRGVIPVEIDWIVE